MRVIRQVLLTVYDDGTTKMSERTMPTRDEKTGRFMAKPKAVACDGPMFPEIEKYFKQGE